MFVWQLRILFPPPTLLNSRSNPLRRVFAIPKHQMASYHLTRSALNFLFRAPQSLARRTLTTQATTTTSNSLPEAATDASNTHFKITLRRSAISMGDKIQETLVSLGIHRRFQTVYHPHGPEVAGKILRVKELVEVENVPQHLVQTKQQMRQARKATRGYKVVGRRSLDLTGQ